MRVNDNNNDFIYYLLYLDINIVLSCSAFKRILYKSSTIAQFKILTIKL